MELHAELRLAAKRSTKKLSEMHRQGLRHKRRDGIANMALLFGFVPIEDETVVK